MKRVAIVVGHAGDQQGARSYNNNTEWVWCSGLAGDLLNNLRAHRIDSEVFYRAETGRYRDRMEDLTRRVNAYRPDLVVSLHFNAFGDETVKGCEVLHHPDSRKGKEWAKRFVDRIAHVIGHGRRGKNGTRGQILSWSGAQLYILTLTKAPAVIVETHFGTCKADHDRATLVRPQIAAALAHEIAKEAQ